MEDFDISKLGELLKQAGDALEQMKSMIPEDAAGEQADSIDEATGEAEEDSDTTDTLKPSTGSSPENDMKKNLAIASLSKHL